MSSTMFDTNSDPTEPLPHGTGSYPLLHGVFVEVLSQHGALPGPFVFKLDDGVDQHQDAQGQDAGDHHRDGVDRGGDAVEGHHDVHVVRGQLAVSTVPTGALQVGLEAAHPVPENRPGIPRLNPQLLVVEPPVVLFLVEVGVNCGEKRMFRIY